MGKIKVVDITSTDQGAYRLLRTRVKKINNDYRFENYIISPGGEWAEKIKSLGIKHIPFEMDRKLNPINTLREIRRLEKLIMEIDPDIVHSHNSKAGAAARIAVSHINKKHKKSIKIVHQVHGYYFTVCKGIKKNLFLCIENYLAKKTDVLLFQNKYELNLSFTQGMNKYCDLEYIGNGVNLEEFNEYLTEANNYKKYNNRKILCIARLEHVKNHEMLIRSLGILKNQFNICDFKAVFTGEGDKGKFTKLIEENNLKENIEFTGSLDRFHVIKNISECCISVLTSIKEGKPRALMESLLLGKPCVGTNVTGTDEVIINNKNGYLVELNDDYNFAKAIYNLMVDKKVYDEFSSNAKEYAAKEFNEDIVIEKIKNIYFRCYQEV